MSKYLIVNADDYNSDRERDQGIIHAAKQGIVTSTTVISSLPWQDSALADLGEIFKNRAGIHLNLTKGLPLTKGLRSVVDGQGFFLGKKAVWRRALCCCLNPNEIEDEFSAQIRKLQEAGISPDHMDGNNHIHVFPVIMEIAARVGRDFGISKIRLPLESFYSCREFLKKGLLKKLFIGILSLRAKQVFSRYGFSFTDYFAGIKYPCVARVESIREFLKNLREGTTELMCHPGLVSPAGNPFSNMEREQELAALTHPSVLKDIKEFKINLISYNNL